MHHPALANTAKLYGLPTILTTSLEKGPNGPLLPEIRSVFPNATLISRPGEINAWDNTDFVKAVKVYWHVLVDRCLLPYKLSRLSGQV